VLTGTLLPVRSGHIEVGRLLRYELSVTNTGDATAHDVYVIDTAGNLGNRRVIYPPFGDASAGCVSGSISVTRFDAIDGLVCAFGDLAPGQKSKVVTYTQTPTLAGGLANSVYPTEGLPLDSSGAMPSIEGLTGEIAVALAVDRPGAPVVIDDPSTEVNGKGKGSLSATCERAICDVLLDVTPKPAGHSAPRLAPGLAAARRAKLGTVRGHLRGHKVGHLKLHLNRGGLKRLKRAGRLDVVLSGTVRSGRRRGHVRRADVLELRR
jgi:hypothetical protein